MSRRTRTILITAGLICGVLFARGAAAQTTNNLFHINGASSTIVPNNASFTIPCAYISNPGCGSGGGIATGSVASLGSPLTIQGSQTSTIAGDGTNSQIPELNKVLNVPSNFATAGCAGNSATTDFGACVNALYTSQSSTGVTYIGIQIPSMVVTQAQWQTPINFNISALDVSFFAPGGAELHYGGAGTAITWNSHNSYGHIKTQDYGFTLYGSSTPIYGGLPNNATTTAIVCGGSNGCVGVDFHDISINGFGTGIETKNNAYLDRWDNIAVSGWNGGVGHAVKLDPSSNSGESLQFNDMSITDGGNSTGTKSFYISDNAVADLKIIGGSFDDAQLYIGIANPVTVQNVHFENADSAQYPGYAYIYATSSSASSLNLFSNVFDQDATVASGTPPEYVEEAVGQMTAIGNYFDLYGSQTVPIAIDHSIGASIPQENFCGNQNQNNAYTNLASNIPNLNSSGCWSESSNSFPAGLFSNGSNVNSFYSGSTVAGTYNNSGNWTFAGTTSAAGSATASSFQAVASSTPSFIANLDTNQYASSTTPAGFSDYGTYLNQLCAGNASGTTINLPQGTFNVSSTLNLTQRCTYQGAGGGGTTLLWTGAVGGTVVNENWGTLPHVQGGGIGNLTINCGGSATATGTVGLLLGGNPSGGATHNINNGLTITNCGTGYKTATGTYMSVLNNTTLVLNARNIWITTSSNSGESLEFTNVYSLDCANATTTKCDYFGNNSLENATWEGGSVDDVQSYYENGVNLTYVGVNFENPGYPTYGRYDYHQLASSFYGTVIAWIGGNMQNDATNTAQAPVEFVNGGGIAEFFGLEVSKGSSGAAAVPELFNNGISSVNGIAQACGVVNMNNGGNALTSIFPAGNTSNTENWGCLVYNQNNYVQGVDYSSSNTNFYQNGGVAASIINSTKGFQFNGPASFQTTTTFSGHLNFPTSSVSVSSCGSGASVLGSDQAGAITTGASNAGCTLTFVQPFNFTPVCTATGAKNGVVIIIRSETITTTTVNFADSSNFPTSSIIDYMCDGNPN